MANEVQVGDWVKLTGPDWEGYTDGVTRGSVIQVTEIGDSGAAYAGCAGALYYKDTPNHQISGYEWERVDPVATLGADLGIAVSSLPKWTETVRKFEEYWTTYGQSVEKYLDAVNPDHYKFGNAKVIEITRHLGFLEGNVVKYVTRAGRKGNRLEDLKKARKYLDWAIENAEGENA